MAKTKADLEAIIRGLKSQIEVLERQREFHLEIMTEADKSNALAEVGGNFITSRLNDLDHSYDMIMLHRFTEVNKPSIWYPDEIDDLVTVLLYWKEHRRVN